MTSLVAVGGLLAFMLQLSELFLIKYTSAVTMSVSGTAKLVLVVVISSLAFAHEMSPLNKFGCSLVMLGVLIYNLIKFKELTSTARDAIQYTSVIMLVDRKPNH